MLGSDFGEKEANELISKLLEFSKSDGAITLHLNSDGGSYVGGMRICDVIKLNRLNNPKAPIIGIAIDAFSMAAVILQECDYRMATANSRILLHQTSLTIRLNLTPDSKIKELNNRIEKEILEIKRKNFVIKELIKKRVEHRIPNVYAFLREEKIILPEEALQLNLIDEIV
jgi:ATP-dependent protease ClpP protease subunit